MKLKLKKLNPKAVTPTYATPQSACFDLTAISREVVGNTATYATGLAFGIPKNHAIMVYSRSGHGFSRGMRLANSVGVIDADYTGEVKVKLTYDGTDTPHWPSVGERVAQAMLIKLPVVEFEEVDELGETDRGTGGFGSTGA